MFTDLYFDPAKGLGRIDGKARYWSALLSGDPARVKQERWDLCLFPAWNQAMAATRKARTDPELWQAGFLITKRKDGDLAVTWGHASPLTAWAGENGWTCYAGAVLVQAIWELETSESADLNPFDSFTAWPHEHHEGHVRILETHVPRGHWPMRADEGRRSDED